MTKQEEKIKKDLEVQGVKIEKITDEGGYYSINISFTGDIYHPARPYKIDGIVKRAHDIFVIVSIQKKGL